MIIECLPLSHFSCLDCEHKHRYTWSYLAVIGEFEYNFGGFRRARNHCIYLQLGVENVISCGLHLPPNFSCRFRSIVKGCDEVELSGGISTFRAARRQTNNSRLNDMSTDFTYLKSLVDASFVNLIGMVQNKWHSDVVKPRYKQNEYCR